MDTIYDIIKRPIISEKSTALQEIGNKYAFEVAGAANKQQIREAVQKLFSVQVQQVRTLMIHGKVKRAGQFVTKRPNWKKAIVTLAEGQKIDFFQNK
jgi:large subunit ribosomal protein L23